MGLACWDYLAQVATFPEPDQKIRTLQLQTRGGGNAGNALTAASRLGVHSYLVTKLGDDGVGDQIAQELRSDRVDLSFVIRAQNSVSDFTYLIVDKKGGTRTCIQTHSDASEYTVHDLRPDTIASILADAKLVYFDGRLTEAATELAKAAGAKGIPVLVEAERLRPGLDALLQEADYLCTSTHFPKLWTKEATLGDAMLAMLQRLPKVKWMVSTLGKKGSVLLQRSAIAPNADSTSLDDTLTSLLQRVTDSDNSANPVACITADDVHIRAGNVVSTEQPSIFQYTDQHHTTNSSPASSAQQTASTHANYEDAQGNGTSSTSTTATMSSHSGHDNAIGAIVIVASAASLPQGAVQDTTGAGDAFIGTVLYAVTHGLAHQQMLKLAGVVAASGCTGLGSRPGLPHAHQISSNLLRQPE